MKKLIPVLIITISLLSAQALFSFSRTPIKKGGFITGGTFNLSSFSGLLFEDSVSSRGIDFGFYPQLLYFVGDGFAIGGEMLMNYSNRGEHEYFGIGVGPAVKYFYSASYRMYPYVGAGLVSGVYSVKDTSDFTQTDLSLNAGNIFMINPYIGLDVQAKYTMRLKSPENGEKKSGSIIALLVGFLIFF